MMNSRALRSSTLRLARFQHNLSSSSSSQRQTNFALHATKWSWQNNNHHRNSLGVASSCDFHTFALRRNNDNDSDDNNNKTTSSQIRTFHTTPPSERAVALILGLTTLSALGYAGASAVQSYNEWKEAQPSPEELEEQRKKEETEQAKAKTKDEQEEDDAKQKKKTNDEDDSGPRKNIFKEWFGVGVGSKYYEGGFDEKMTKKEAALILGVRESSSPQRIKDAHRKLLILNHPDTGGSTYLSGKINEAKELLLKGKARV